MSLRINPEYESMLPRMSDEEFAELKASIKTEGQHYSIIVNEDLEVLDGHHRFRACTELGKSTTLFGYLGPMIPQLFPRE